ncbi:MAG: DUF1801 domain-containing protein [Acidobacteria bacterium]|nr:DUF1801 domain-containing protein [Acidobacteriota bacterium]
MVRAPDPRLLEFLAAYDPPIGELALALRAVILEEAPEAVESIYDAYSAVAVGYSFTGKFGDGFLHIASYAKHVNLGFNNGATMADPNNVLVGKGSRIRHVKFVPGGVVETPWLRRYVRAAIESAGGRPDGAAPVAKSEVRGDYPVKRRPKK